MERLIRMRELQGIVGLKNTAIRSRINAGVFPRSVDIGGGRVAWRQSDVDEWLASRPDSNNAPKYDPSAAAKRDLVAEVG